MSCKPRHTTVKTRHGAIVRQQQRNEKAKLADQEMRDELARYM